jgi:hypothetical protein
MTDKNNCMKCRCDIEKYFFQVGKFIVINADA